MTELIDRAPGDVAEALVRDAARRAWIVPGVEHGRGVRTSWAALDPTAGSGWDSLSGPGCAAHFDAVFLAVGEETGALFGAFLRGIERGQPQGGLRHWPYATFRAFLEDGLRLAHGMARKCALAGLWWGGGKGIIARQPGERWRDPGYRRTLYGEYGDFVTSLRGAYVTAEDAGTSPTDMQTLHAHTRFATCVPESVGGSGNPSAITAAGVVGAMQAALEQMGAGPLAGKRVAMQGGGNVGSHMIEMLLEHDVSSIVVAELCADQRGALLDRHADGRLAVHLAEPDDVGILAQPCDILAPNALGGILDDKTIPSVQARLVCGAANNQLADEDRHARMLADHGIVFVPDYLANRMGIVACSNEHTGSLPGDPEIARHLDPSWPESIQAVTRLVLERAEREGTTPVCTANALADERGRIPHPIWPGRTRQLIDGLIGGGWAPV